MSAALIIPVYKNEASIEELLQVLTPLAMHCPQPFEVVFVVDGSPDQSFSVLRQRLPEIGLHSRLILLSRNFGSFAAIRAGLQAVDAEFYAVMAADLQEPPELILGFFDRLAADAADVVIGTRDSRADPLLSKLASSFFWWVYRKFVQVQMPAGGFDLFGCNRKFRDQLLRLAEVRSSLVGQVLWLGFRRHSLGYTRLRRKHGKSAWTFGKKLNYLQDSVFAFTDLPIRLLLSGGLIGIAVSVAVGMVVLTGRLTGTISVPGYAATVLLVLFFAALNLFGLGIVGSYAWRAYENSKRRPESIVIDQHNWPAKEES
ncbi:MAG: glycosyltransferase family 2 protein [Xanthomonadales bacterium]|nr:glycosyltransferase family 2 protein [Xanthomonadales bacterium]